MLIIILSLTLLLAACTPAEDPSLFPEYSTAKAKPIPEKPAVAANPNRNVFWGDLHIHTSYSTDAYTMAVRTVPDDAYTFARGGEIPHAAGYGVQLSKPLDFAAVTDHSEYLGVLRHMQPDSLLSKRGLRQRLLEDGPLRNTILLARSLMGFSLKNIDREDSQAISQSAWADTVAAAERHNMPGVFTTFVAYEWSSFPESINLHRNVIYRSTAVPDVPFSSLRSEDPRDLWAELEKQAEAGMQAFAIPHNGNVSDGKMYDSVAFDGTALDADYAQQRMRHEPISEIFQVKGSSETHPLNSPDDEFAGFEIYDTLLSQEGGDSRPKGSYIRDALRLGMELSHQQQFNPYRFGVIGASDGHNASSPVEEDNYHGKLPLLDGSAALRLRTASYFPKDMPGGQRWSAAGLAGVWAKENTREALFDAMRRKETYATSGPRITVRFFGGWNYPSDLPSKTDWIEQAEQTGVPMGGTLTATGSGEVPSFALWALRDPDGANLDRIQIIKGWVDDDGQSQEKIINVAWSGERQIDVGSGKLEAIRNTVDVKTASYRNDIGAQQLVAVWKDPEFAPDLEAFYYARVIEIPTPRWTTFDALSLGIEPPQPSSLQERAVTSAIWYTP